jgi:hypothetical protein
VAIAIVISRKLDGQHQSSQTHRGQMKQRRGTSLIESILNCVIGVGIATIGQIIIFPWFGIHVSLLDTGLIALIFTGVSVLRSYLVRRLFEYLRVTGIMP